MSFSPRASSLPATGWALTTFSVAVWPTSSARSSSESFPRMCTLSSEKGPTKPYTARYSSLSHADSPAPTASPRSSSLASSTTLGRRTRSSTASSSSERGCSSRPSVGWPTALPLPKPCASSLPNSIAHPFISPCLDHHPYLERVKTYKGGFYNVHYSAARGACSAPPNNSGTCRTAPKRQGVPQRDPRRTARQDKSKVLNEAVLGPA